MDNTIQTFTFSALSDILSDSFATHKTHEFSACGSYYYSEIKSAKWENRCIRVQQCNLDAVSDKITHLTIIEKKKLITRALCDFTFRNIPYCDAVGYSENMRWKIVE